MKLIAPLVKRKLHQGQAEAQDDDWRPLSHCGEPFEVSLQLTDRLSIRCECYLCANDWFSLVDSPELRFIVWRAVERAASGCHPAKEEDGEKR